MCSKFFMVLKTTEMRMMKRQFKLKWPSKRIQSAKKKMMRREKTKKKKMLRKKLKLNKGNNRR
jgi:hypothetical protein